MIKLGTLNLPLTNLGRNQALSAKVIMEGLGLFKRRKVIMITSPYIRALQTAEILSGNKGHLVSVDERLRERTLNSENLEDKQLFFARVKSFLEDAVLRNTIICSHAKVFDAFKVLLKIKDRRQIKMGQIVELSKSKSWQMKFIN